MNPLIVVVLLAGFIEGAIEALKPALAPVVDRLPIPEDVNVYMYLSIIAGLALAFLYGANALVALGLDVPNEAAGIIGTAGTGIVIGRGANAAHDFMGWLVKLSQGQAQAQRLED